MLIWVILLKSRDLVLFVVAQNAASTGGFILISLHNLFSLQFNYDKTFINPAEYVLAVSECVIQSNEGRLVDTEVGLCFYCVWKSFGVQCFCHYYVHDCQNGL